MFSSLFYIVRKTSPIWVGASLYYTYVLCTKGNKAADTVADNAEDTVQDLTNLAIKLIFDNGEALILSQTDDQIDPIISSVLQQIKVQTQKYANNSIDSTFSLITNIIKNSVEDLKSSQSMQDLRAIADKLQSSVNNSSNIAAVDESHKEGHNAIVGEAHDYQKADDGL